MEKEVKVVPPEGYEIDKENSTFECIRFKPINVEKRFVDNEDIELRGYYIDYDSFICNANDCRCKYYNIPKNYNIFATQKQAKSALAMARISQIMANDERFGGVVTDEEWKDADMCKHVIDRAKDEIKTSFNYSLFGFLAFHTAKQRDLFLKENEQLVKDYLMID